MSPVVVVGCGPTGACAAIMLAQRGIDVVVFERWPDPYPLPRAVHFDDEVHRILSGLGIGPDLTAISRPAPGMQLVDASLRVLATFRRDHENTVHGYPQANMFHQPELEAVLRRRMAQCERITLHTGVEVLDVAATDDGGAEVLACDVASGAERTVLASAVLACDGANSTVRTMIGAELRDLGFEQQWMVVDVASSVPLDVYDGVQQICDHDRAATFMMVTPGRYRWEFRLRAGESADALDDPAVLALIRPWLGDTDPSAITVVRRAWYTFRGAVADRWSAGRVFLLGDAAHLTPPFIGQGLCAGIRDAANLTWKLALVLRGLADDRLLDTYQAERRAHAERVVRLAMAVGWVMTGGSSRSSRLRRSALRAASRLPGVQGRVAEVAMPSPGRSALVADADPAAGRSCPQPVVAGPAGRVRLDEVLGADFAVVTSSWDGVAAFDPETRAFFDSLGTRVVADATTAGFDVDGGLHSFLGRTGARAVLVRPDRVVSASADRADLRTWRTLLETAGITGGDRAR